MPASGWAGEVGVAAGVGSGGALIGGIPNLTPTGTPGVTTYTMAYNVTQPMAGYSGALADPSGANDSSPAIQFALSHCPNNEYVYIPGGTYRLNSGISRQGVNNYDNVQRPFSIAIKGNGPSLTKLYYYGTSNPAFYFAAANSNTLSASITGGDSRGSTSLVLSGASAWYQSLSGGVTMYVLRPNAAAITPYTNGGGNDSNEGIGNVCSQMVEITGVSGNTVSFSPALNEAYAGSDSVSINISIPYRCGIQDLYIENMVDQGADNIQIQQGDQCWVKNVESNDASAYHVRLYNCVRCEVRECVIHNCWEAGGGRGYGVDLFEYSCNNLVEDNIFYMCRHAMPMEAGGQGNVFGYNYSFDPVNSDNGSGLSGEEATDYLMGDSINHGGEPRWNLREGNVCATIRFDDCNGGSAWNTAFRNQVQRKGLPATYIACFGSDIQRFNYYASLSGNVYENPPTAYNPAQYGSRRWGSDQDTPYPCSWAVANATNTGPIKITVTAPAAGTEPAFIPGQTVVISGVTGNAAANGTWTITAVGAADFTLNGSSGNGTYGSGGTVASSDPLSLSSAILDGEYDCATSTLTWAGSDHTLPNSYYLASKPTWWLPNLAWPAIDPNNPVASGTTLIPAGYRYVNGAPADTRPRSAARKTQRSGPS